MVEPKVRSFQRPRVHLLPRVEKFRASCYVPCRPSQYMRVSRGYRAVCLVLRRLASISLGNRQLGLMPHLRRFPENSGSTKVMKMAAMMVSEVGRKTANSRLSNGHGHGLALRLRL